jgi:hypothetical protein
MNSKIILVTNNTDKIPNKMFFHANTNTNNGCHQLITQIFERYEAAQKRKEPQEKYHLMEYQYGKHYAFICEKMIGGGAYDRFPKFIIEVIDECSQPAEICG